VKFVASTLVLLDRIAPQIGVSGMPQTEDETGLLGTKKFAPKTA